MTFQAIAIHRAHPDHVEAFAGYMRRVMAATTGAPGLLEFTSWRESDGTTLIGFSRWESREAFEAGLERIGSLRHERRPEWTAGDDEVMTFTEL